MSGLVELARGALSRPTVFTLFRHLLGGPACHRRFIDAFVRPQPGDRLLDVGCGTAPILEYLPAEASYVGVDVSPAYIAAAHERFQTRGTFLCGDAASIELSTLGPFDVAIASGLLHHLDDRAVRALLRRVRRHLRPGGHLVTLDPCHQVGQPWIAKLLIAHDRGRFVRDANGYRALLAEEFGTIDSHVLGDMLRIPYTLIAVRAGLQPVGGR